jgi:ATP-dependent Zn protease
MARSSPRCGACATVSTRENRVLVTLHSGREYEVGYPRAWGGDLVARLQAAGATFEIEPDRRPWGATLLMLLLPVVLVVGFAWLLIRRSSAGGRATTFDRSPSKQLAFDAPKITFLEKVTATAKQMVMRFGMSEKLGPRVFGHDHGQPFLGREFSAAPDHSGGIGSGIDREISRIVKAAHRRATDTLLEHRASLVSIAEILVRRETLDRSEFTALLAGRSESEVFTDDAAVIPFRRRARVISEVVSAGGDDRESRHL